MELHGPRPGSEPSALWTGLSGKEEKVNKRRLWLLHLGDSAPSQEVEEASLKPLECQQHPA